MTIETPMVLVVDDDESICASLRRLLKSAGYQVRTFCNTRRVFEHGRPEGPCCLVLDVRLPDDDGLAFQQELKSLGINVPIVFISGCGDIPSTVRAMRAGAVDFLEKPYDPRQLLDRIESALRLDQQSRAHEQHLAQVRLRYARLTDREREVFAAVTAGMLNKQVAYDLGITEKTIKVHRAHVMQKMGAVCLAELIRMADLLSFVPHTTSMCHACSGAVAATIPLQQQEQ